MNQAKRSFVGVSVALGLLTASGSASAWVAAAGGWRGGAVAVGHPAYYHPPYYHPPTGCYGCGAAAGAVVGMAVGTAVATAARPTTVVVAQPAYYGGVPVIGSQFAVLPPGADQLVVNGVTYYQSGPTWYKPFYGSSGVYYDVVPAP